MRKTIQVAQPDVVTTRPVKGKGVHLDMYSFVGKVAVAYPKWMSRRVKRCYWFLLQVCDSILRNYFFFFGVWVGVVIFQLLLPNLVVWFCLLSGLVLVGFTAYNVMLSIRAAGDLAKKL